MCGLLPGRRLKASAGGSIVEGWGGAEGRDGRGPRARARSRLAARQENGVAVTGKGLGSPFRQQRGVSVAEMVPILRRANPHLAHGFLTCGYSSLLFRPALVGVSRATETPGYCQMGRVDPLWLDPQPSRTPQPSSTRVCPDLSHARHRRQVAYPFRRRLASLLAALFTAA